MAQKSLWPSPTTTTVASGEARETASTAEGSQQEEEEGIDDDDDGGNVESSFSMVVVAPGAATGRGVQQPADHNTFAYVESAVVFAMMPLRHAPRHARSAWQSTPSGHDIPRHRLEDAFLQLRALTAIHLGAGSGKQHAGGHVFFLSE